MKDPERKSTVSSAGETTDWKNSDGRLLYKTLFEQSPDGVLIVDALGSFIDFNEAAHRQLGYSREEFGRLRISDIDPVESAEEIQAKIRQLIESGSCMAFEVKHRTKAGEIRDVYIINQPLTIAGRTVVHSIWRDITGQKRAEEANIQSEKRFHALFANTPLGVVNVDAGRRIIDCNSAFQKMLGYSLEELKARTVPEISHADDDLATRDRYRAMISGEIDSYSEEKRYIRKDGSTLWANLTGTVIRDNAGKPQYFFGIIEDITERKKAEESLLLFRNLLDRTKDAIFVNDPATGRFLIVNNMACDNLGYSRNELLAARTLDIEALFPDQAAWDAHVRELKSKGHLILEGIHKRRDGTSYPAEINVTYMTLGKRDYMVAVARDITERKKIEEQILRTQKLEAVGILAGGIAHDFNNLLQGIFGSLSLAKTHSAKEGKAYALLESAESALYQATSLTKQLLTFSKGGEPVKKVLALPSVVDNAVKFALSGSNIGYQSFVDERLRPVEVDEGQLSQVIHNIVLNACDAMPDGGNIRIDMHNVPVDERGGLPLEKGDYVNVEITDSGTGIHDDHLSKIFDPYFTTKEKGSGLGLATSYSIIKKHGGAITVRSQPGAGSTFSLYLPASERELSPEDVHVTGAIPGKGRILVMDDEEIVLMVAQHMVEELGYEVSLAEDGVQALELFSGAIESHRPFDAVILDLTIRGGMGGKETLMKMAALEPSVRAIVSSGYSSDDILAHYKEYGFQDILIKPYESEALSRMLHELLHREDPS